MAISTKISNQASSKSFGTQNASKTQDSFSIRASAIPVNLGGNLAGSKNVNDALQRLDGKTAAQPGTPVAAVEGDIWYDTDDDKFYVRDEDSWNEIVVSGISGTVDGGGYS
jgi:hypothetical protein